MAEQEDKKPFGVKLLDILVRDNDIDPEILQEAEEKAKATDVRLEKFLVQNNIVPGPAMTLALADYLEMTPVSLAHFKPAQHVIEMIPKQSLTKHQIVPVARNGKTLTIALADPFDIFAIDEIHMLTGLEIIPLVASEKEVREVLEKTLTDQAGSIDMEDIMKEMDENVQVEAQEEGDKESLESMMSHADDMPVIKMVNMIIMEGLRMKANDIHIEPQEDYVRLRYRVDGALLERPNLQKSLQSAIVSRVKIMADLDIGEQRLPQDGAFRITAMGKKIDVRVSILPTYFGPKVVMRTLDKSALFPNLAALDLDEKSLQAFGYAIAQPNGIILVTGPTGSGKTTTLYSCLQELNTPNVNVVTCEDPPEYQVPGLNQVKINTEVGLTFASSLRAILRQDPDICLIGEIRDSETCEIAIKAALTGHLVLSTLHANEAAGTITRLLEMGVEPFLLASSLILTQAQRLFRKLCTACKKEVPQPKELMEQYRIDQDFFKGVTMYGPKGCPKCHSTGFLGRAAIMEVLPIEDEIRTAILERAIANEIRRRAEARGMITLRNAILAKVKKGETNLETAIRLTVGDE